MPTGYLTTEGIDAVVVHLAATYDGLVDLITLPETTVGGRTIHGLHIGATRDGSRRGVALLAGVHARELVNPDLLVTFVARLLAAYTNGTGVSFGPVNHTAGEVKTIIDGLELFVVPLVNPDGRSYVQQPGGDPMWRKNRNPNPGKPCKGVDLNRNYDFLWSSGIGTSTSACTEVFRGASAFSEPETRNIRNLLDTRPNIMCLADVHSYSELILFPWGDDDNQSTDPTMNFANPAFDGARGVSGAGYREYIDAADATWFSQTGNAVRDAIAAVRGRTYTVEQGIALYPTSATVHDYAYSRHIVDTGKRKVLGFTVETAREFQPPWSEAEHVIEEVSAGLFILLVRALCAAETVLTGTTAEVRLADLRTLRDDVLAASPTGRRLVALFEAHGAEILLLLGSAKKQRNRVATLVNAWEKATRAEGGMAVAAVPAKVVDDGLALLTELAATGSPGLRRTVRSMRKDLGTFRGQSVAAALRKLDG